MRSTFPAVVALMVLALALTNWPGASRSVSRTAAAADNSNQSSSSSGAQVPRLNISNKSPDDLRTSIDSILKNYAISLDFTGQPLNEVMDFVHDKFPELKIYYDDPALKDAGIDKTTTLVTITLSEVRLKTALETMLNQFNLGYRVHDGLLIIATKEKLDSTLETRIYDCHEILSADNDQFRKAFGENRSDNQAGATAKKPTSVAQSNQDTLTANENTSVKPVRSFGIDQLNSPAANLIKVITNSVSPQSWSEQGGPCSLYEYSGMLIVNQTYEGQTKIADLLEKLSTKLTPHEKK